MKKEHKIDKAFLIKLTQSFALGLIICIVTIFFRWNNIPVDVFYKKIFFAVCDGAFIAGSVLLAISILTVTKKDGMINAITFSMKIISNRIRNIKTPSYYEYTKQKEKDKSEQKFHWLCFAISGLFFILIAIISMFFC